MLPLVLAAALTAFVDVSVVPMDAERILAHQTVVVQNGRILAVGDAGRLAVPAGAVVVPGEGRYLLPGLYDLYAHAGPRLRRAWLRVPRGAGAGARAARGGGAPAARVGRGLSVRGARLLRPRRAGESGGSRPRSLRGAASGHARRGRVPGELDQAGTVSAGKRADLLLLSANPLEDVRHAARRVGVMASGRWLPEEELQGRLQRLATSWEAPRDRFAGFPAPARDEPGAVRARYEVRLRGVVAGEQRMVRGPLRAGVRTLRAQASIDPHLATRTDLTVTLDPRGRALGARVFRWMAGAEARVRVRRLGRRSRVEARLGAEPAAHWEEDLPDDALLGGPLLAVNLDLDVVANIQLLVDRARERAAGQGTLVRMKRIELNEEEHGRAGVTGDVACWVVPEKDGHLRIYSPGLNGSGASVLRARLAADGLIEGLASEDGSLTVTRIPWQ